MVFKYLVCPTLANEALKR